MCTAVRFTDTQGHMFWGRNYDWNVTYGETPVIMPKGFPLKREFGPTEPAKYAAIGMAIINDGYPLFFNCGNEAGLAIGGLNFAQYSQLEQEPIEGKNNLAAYELPAWVGANFATVDEVEEALKNVALVAKAPDENLGVATLHWMISDAKRSIVVESRADGMHVMDDPVDVLTNQPSLEWHLENLRSYVTATSDFPANAQWGRAELAPYGAGAGMRGIPGDCYSPSRFVKVAYLNAHYPAKDSEADNVVRMFRTLEGVAMVEGAARMGNGDFERTLYTSCFSGQTGRYYWSTYDDPAIRYVSLADAASAPADLLVTPEPRA